MLANKGFTLIEVLVASSIIMLGVTGFASLQSQYVVADAKLNLRHLALQLAQDKLTDLHYFSEIMPAVDTFSYSNIVNDSGGDLPAGEHLIQLSAITTHVHAFVVNWQVTDLYYVDTNSDDVRDSWVKIGDAFFPIDLPKYADIKTVKVTINWLDTQGEPAHIEMLGNIAPIAQGLSFHTKYREIGVLAHPY